MARTIRSMREFCMTYFPERHARRECDCFKPESPLEKFLREWRERLEGSQDA